MAALAWTALAIATLLAFAHVGLRAGKIWPAQTARATQLPEFSFGAERERDGFVTFEYGPWPFTRVLRFRIYHRPGWHNDLFEVFDPETAETRTGTRTANIAIRLYSEAYRRAETKKRWAAEQ